MIFDQVLLALESLPKERRRRFHERAATPDELTAARRKIEQDAARPERERTNDPDWLRAGDIDQSGVVAEAIDEATFDMKDSHRCTFVVVVPEGKVKVTLERWLG